jgi:predicted nucleic acid-binding Zn ribbon protein
MPIIACPECGHQVSTTAKACPGCGHAVADARKSKQKGWTILLILVFALVVVAVVSGDNQPSGDKPKKADGDKPKADPIPMIGETWYTKGTPIGCRDSKDLDRLGELARQNDNAAFTTFYIRQSMAGRCAKLDQGVQVNIESGSVWGSPCVRPKGDPFCLYVLTGFLEKTPTQK